MNTILAVMATLLGAGFGQQQQAPRETPGLVAVGKVSRIEPRRSAFEIATETAAPAPPNVWEDEVHSGITIGRGLRGERLPSDVPARDHLGLPPLGTEDSDDTERRRTRKRFTKSTVFLTPTTSCREREAVITCTELKAGDTVRVTGEERSDVRGRGLYATEVFRIKLR